MTVSIRLEKETKAALEEIARRHGTSQSDLVRSATEGLIERESSTLYERIEDLIGCVEGGPSGLSEHTGRRFRELLEQKAQ